MRRYTLSGWLCAQQDCRAFEVVWNRTVTITLHNELPGVTVNSNSKKTLLAHLLLHDFLHLFMYDAAKTVSPLTAYSTKNSNRGLVYFS